MLWSALRGVLSLALVTSTVAQKEGQPSKNKDKTAEKTVDFTTGFFQTPSKLVVSPSAAEEIKCQKFDGWIGSQKKPCLSADTPSKCIRANELCAWCADESFQYNRCATEDNLINQNCNSIQTIKSGLEKNEDEPGRIQPQEVTATIRVGDYIDVDFKITEPDIYPVELYYLMDVSYSMRDDMETMKVVGEKMSAKLKELTGAANADPDLVRIGFGTFVDKVTSPQTETIPYRLKIPFDDAKGPLRTPFVYRNVNPLSSDINAYKENLKDELVSGNLDGPEGALEAMYHAANCPEQIGWHQNTLKLLVLATESWFHFGGDGMGRLAGLLEPNPQNIECQLEDDEVKVGDQYDYPTVHQIVQKLHENSIIPIFAVRKGQLHLYDEATEQLFRGGTAQALERNSSNILDLIEESYKRITQKQHLILKQSDEISKDSLCLGTQATHKDNQGNVTIFKHGEDVTNLNSNSEVSYILRESVHPEAVCNDENEVEVEGEIKIRTQRYEDTLTVKTVVKCNFECMRDRIVGAEKCNYHGDYECGICDCYQNYFGDECQFEKPPCPNNGANCSDCINPVTNTICTDQGECPDNYCLCDSIPGGTLSGKWCQCNTQHCFNSGSIGDRGICSGHGTCQCDKLDGRGISKCECDAGFEGEKCECSTDTSACYDDNGIECGGKGKCQCGKCVCDNPDEWTGLFCTIPNCSNRVCATCEAFSACIECLYHSDCSDKDGPETCSDVCNTEWTINGVEKGFLTTGDPFEAWTDGPVPRPCSAMTTDPNCKRCKFYYSYKEKDDGSVEIWAEKDKVCILEYSLLIILWAVLIALLIGLLFLCCWRICVFCVDREKKYATVAYLVEFIKAKHHFKRSQSVAVIPVRRSVFDDKLKCKYRTFPGSVSDDVVKVMREGEAGKNQMEMQKLIGEPDWGSGVIEWENGEEIADIQIDIKNQHFEGTETAFWVELLDAPQEIHYGRRRTKVLLIRDDDPGSIGFLKPHYVFKESDLFAVVPIHRTNGSDGQTTVNYRTRDVTAHSGTHYKECQGQVTFEDGELSKDVEIELLPDSAYECIDKSFNLELSNPTNGAVLDRDKCLVRILFDETASVVQFVRPAYPFLENCSFASVPVIRTRSTKGISLVHYKTRDITAKSGVDYRHTEGILEFGNEETEKTIDIQIIENDQLIEEGRTFNLELFEPSEGTKVGRKDCSIKIIEDDDPGRFELIRSNYVFKCGSSCEIPIIRSMGADGRVEVPWVIEPLPGKTLPPEAKLSGTVVFESMSINGAIDLFINADWSDDVSVNLRLLQPTNNARLGGIEETTLQILGKGQFDEVNMEIPLAEIIRGNGQSPVTVNFNRIIRTVNQTTVVMFETLDGTALEEKHDYYGIKKAIIFEPHMTQQQVQIHVNDEYDEDLQDVFFKLKMTPVSDHVILNNPEGEIAIVSPINETLRGNMQSRYGAKISFVQKKYLCRMSERQVQIEIKRQGKEEKEVSCHLVSEMIEGDLMKATPDIDQIITFEPNVGSETFTWNLPNIESKQVLVALRLVEFSKQAMEGSITECEVTIINDIHAGVVGFSVPEMTYRVTDLKQKIDLLRAGGTDGALAVTIVACNQSAENGTHFDIPSPLDIDFKDGQNSASFDIDFIPGNHGKKISRSFELKIETVSGSGRVGQSTCTIHLVTDQSPCSVSFAKGKFSFLANSGDQGVPLLRTGANENAAEIEWQLLNLPDGVDTSSFATSGVVVINPGSNRTLLKIPADLIDATVNDKFDISIRAAPGQSAVSLAEFSNATISVISGAEHGKFEFLKTRLVCKQNERIYELPVIRQGGSDGIVEVKYSLKSKIECYNGLSGSLTFGEGVFEQNIVLDINPDMVADTDTFTVVLNEVSLGSIGTRNEAFISVVRESKELEFEFSTDYISTKIGDISAHIDIIVHGELEDRVSLRFTTQPESAIPGRHYLTKSEQVLFKPGEAMKSVQIGLLEPPLEEPVTLTLALLVADGPGRIGPKSECVINIPPAGHPGQVSFTMDYMEVNQSEKAIQLVLSRARGTRGALLCPWSVFSDNWYNNAAGQIMFEDGQSETFIDFPLMAQPTDDPFHEFRVDLRKPNGQAELGAMPSLTIRVNNDVPGGIVQFASEMSEIIANDGDTYTNLAVESDGQNRTAFDLCYQLAPLGALADDDIAAELENSFNEKEVIPAGVRNILLNIPIQYLPSGEVQEFYAKLISSNHGVRLGKQRLHKVRIVSQKRKIGFVEDKVTALQSNREIILQVQRTVSQRDNLIVPWMAYTSPEPVKGVLTFCDGQEFDQIRIPFKQVYVSDNPLVESFDVEINPGPDYDLSDFHKCQVTLHNDLGPGVVEFRDEQVSLIQSAGQIALRLVRHERTMEEATVKWRIYAKEGSVFKGVVGTVQFHSGDDHLDLIIPVDQKPCDQGQDQFVIELEQPINATLGDATKCKVTMLNDKIAGEMAFADGLPKKFLQSQGSFSVDIIRTKVAEGDVYVPYKIVSSNEEYSMTGKLEFLSGETVQSFILDMLAVPQEYDVDELEFILEQPQGGARLKDGYQKLDIHIENDIMDAPTNITTEVAATSCLIKWSLQKYVREYQITYSETNRNSIKLAKVDGNEDNVLLLDLQPCSEYEIMIAAINQFGNSATSETITIVTPGLPPGKPSRLAFQLLSPTSLQVNWGEPQHCNGEISAYCVEYHTIDEDSGIEPVMVPLPGPDHRSLLVENLIENTEYRYTVRAENRWGLGEMRTARMWIKPMQGKGSRPPSTVVLGSESSVNAHSIYQDEHGRNQHYCEVEDDTTTDCYRSEKHKSWTTRSKGGFTTDTGNSDIDIDINTPRTEDMISEPFSPDSFGHRHSGSKMTKTEFKSPTSDHRSLLTQQTTTLSPNKLLETTIDVNTNPEVKVIKTQDTRKYKYGGDSYETAYQKERSFTGQETYKRDVKHNIKRDEHVDTAVQNYEYGDTEVTTVKKTITQREVHETIETLSGEKKFSTQESTTPKILRRKMREQKRSQEVESDSSDAE